jgi:membrane-associated HD superfamily phosphohydrolase
MKSFLDHTSFWGAVAGSMLMALKISVSGWAFLLFLLSNIATIYLLKDSDASKSIIYQSYFFVVINLVGIVRWLL